MQLAGEPVDDIAALADENTPELVQGTVQQETLHFQLPEPVVGLRCVKKYTVGELSWDQTVMMGDFPSGPHAFQMPSSTVPTGKLTVGRYWMKTVFMDARGTYLWAGVNTFKVVGSHV